MRRDKYGQLPVYRKSQEIFEIMADVLKEGEMEDPWGQMRTHTTLIQAKIAGAEGGGIYTLQMQNAVLIKLAVPDMFNAISIVLPLFGCA